MRFRGGEFSTGTTGNFQSELTKYIDGQFTPLSKPFKTKEQAEKGRLKYPERQRRTMGLGVVRLPK
jgi:hypothetical protein